MTSIDELQQCECEKLDPLFIDAYLELLLDGSRLILDSSWGETSVDLTDAIKFGETITHMFLTPEGDPRALQYNREDYMREGAENQGIDCIEGDDLSRIISMRYLRDVDQNTPPRGGDVYMYDEVHNTFYTFNLQDYMDKTDKRLDDLEGRVGDLEQDLEGIRQTVNIFDTRIKDIQNRLTNFINDVEARLSKIEQTIAKPSYVPNDAKLVWGTTNVEYELNPNGKGLWSHDIATNVEGDCRFA